ncbi:tyrosine-type recombinase/integrase [Bifidobacterium platyrrhinorum]|uniref:Tyrosine-type recombinase/integrase n=1 Tax=Bifidobacterium platyrrhinorum TaxID=2661628 RepID=A0A6L9SV29_9BIFI|nr:tyrosine-type recombinase/integrase [Bifidobacterium platyrrhinorum]
MRVSDIDLEHRLLRVRHSANRGDEDRGPMQLGKTKTKSSRRTVPIPMVLTDMISRHISSHCGNGRSIMMFPAKKSSSGILSPTTLQKYFRTAREIAGRPDSHSRPCASHATLYMLKGGTLREVMDELGHSSAQVAIRHYQRIVPEHRT